MTKLIITKGLPASGKSTWAKEQVLKSGGRTKRVNKDDLRSMIDNSLWSKTNEKNILAIRDSIVKHYLLSGNDVIVDDTNLTPNHKQRLSEIAEEVGADFEIQSFLDVPMATCILRNAQRLNPVPEKAIKSMYYQFIKNKPGITPYVAPKRDPHLPDCIIVDIDGTLAHMSGRSPYDYTKVLTDVPDTAVRTIVDSIDSDVKKIIVSGREGTEQCEEDTGSWLFKHGPNYDQLYMRPEGDKRNDAIVKREIYEQHIKGKYNVLFVLDDRNRVVDMWRNELGLKCLQVAEGDF